MHSKMIRFLSSPFGNKIKIKTNFNLRVCNIRFSFCYFKICFHVYAFEFKTCLKDMKCITPLRTLFLCTYGLVDSRGQDLYHLIDIIYHKREAHISWKLVYFSITLSNYISFVNIYLLYIKKVIIVFILKFLLHIQNIFIDFLLSYSWFKSRKRHT